MASYDDYVLGYLNSDHPCNQPEPKPILVVCDGCDDLIPENEIVEDGDWYWCPACWAQIQEETKAPELSGAIQ